MRGVRLAEVPVKSGPTKKRTEKMNHKRIVRGFQVLIQPDKEEVGGFFGTVMTLPGCVRHGETEKECAENVGKAIDDLRKILGDHAADMGVRCGNN